MVLIMGYMFNNGTVTVLTVYQHLTSSRFYTSTMLGG